MTRSELTTILTAAVAGTFFSGESILTGQ